MTGRRSHGRLSALNGVVHQGKPEPEPEPEPVPALPLLGHLLLALGLTAAGARYGRRGGAPGIHAH